MDLRVRVRVIQMRRREVDELVRESGRWSAVCS